MNREQATNFIQQTFTHAFDKSRFHNFALNLLNRFDESKAFSRNSQYIKDAFKDHVQRFERLGTYTSPGNDKLDVLVVHLTNDAKLERARTAIRNFVADHLKERDEKDAALVAFVSPTEKTWRLSYVKMEYATVKKESGKVGVEERLTPARRFSYLVGEGESCHTAQTRFLDLLKNTETDPTLNTIEEAFSVESVTKEFFKKYFDLFEDLRKELEKLIGKDKTIRNEFTAKRVNPTDFAKKLMGQIVFLYFLQKKGWLGVPKGQDWGTGPRDFLRRLASQEYAKYDNFFNDVLEPLFYDTLATNRGHEAWCNRFKCRIPFLNGGLFEPLNDYKWEKADILLPNTLFTNNDPVEEGINGTGVLDVFDRYNFTVNEAEPLEKEVAIDPEMLGKVFENLIEENRRKGLGAFYTPREIVHYMCQESLINYLDTTLNHDSVLAPRTDIETLIHLGEQISHYEAVQAKYAIKMPKSIEQHAQQLDKKLADITICDPAVGSGAFPVGMMTEIVRVRSALTPYFKVDHERTPYHFKRHAIQNCLYGVDIDPGAVEIAKLRLWLSLIVDEEDIKQIQPLPNLDYKVVVGNSLLGFPFKSQKIETVEGLKQQYFSETDQAEKGRLKTAIDKALQECFTASKRSLGYEVSFDFKVLFSEVFHNNGGFDVVLANPPYVDAHTQVRLGEEERTILASLFKTAKGPWDLYIVFWERSLQLTNERASVSLITPNKWLSVAYGRALRSLVKASIWKLVDYSSFRAFEDIGVFPVVAFVSRQNKDVLQMERFEEGHVLTFKASIKKSDLDRFADWGFMLSTNPKLILRLSTSMSKLSEFCAIEEAFAVGEAYELRSIVREINSNNKDSFKFVNTGTIDPYVSLWGTKPTTYLKAKFERPIVPKAEFKKNFPRRFQQMSSPKIITSGMRHFESFLDAKGEYVAGISTVVLREFTGTYSPELLLALLNSSFISFYLRECYSSVSMDGGINFTRTNISEVPIPHVDQPQQTAILRRVDAILAAKRQNPENDTTALEHEIDNLVYKLYDLTPEEIAIVENRRS